MRKRCSACGECKKRGEFYSCSKNVTGLQSSCISCKLEAKRTKQGKISKIYSSQKVTSKIRNHPPPNYDLQELINWCMSQQLFHTIYHKWQESNYPTDLSPSCDRKDDSKPYTLDNLQLKTWRCNLDKEHQKQRIERGKAVVSIHKHTKVQTVYNSAHEAAAITGAAFQNILSCCHNKYGFQSAKGYKWIFAEKLEEWL